jgi:hypothetical protein
VVVVCSDLHADQNGPTKMQSSILSLVMNPSGKWALLLSERRTDGQEKTNERFLFSFPERRDYLHTAGSINHEPEHNINLYSYMVICELLGIKSGIVRNYKQIY